jgi:hydroxyacylglutathione hydrolase
MAVDSPDGDNISRHLEKKNWKLTHIFNTHHHHDHVEGNEILKGEHGCEIIGAAPDAGKIPAIDAALEDGEEFDFGRHRARLLLTPGHTAGSACLHFPQAALLFTGDTLFSMGCGRLFEGDAAQMRASLQKIAALPDETLIYCGHEYSLTNAEFAMELEPGNKELQKRLAEVKKLRRERRATLPVTLGVEKATNPFLRPHSREIRRNLHMEDASDIEVFAAIRELRNNY